MNKKTTKSLQNQNAPTQDSVLFLSFCRALEKYCDQIGVYNPRFSAVRILHDAACNTVSQMRTITPAQRRHMAQMERNIPEMFAGLIAIHSTDGFINTVEKLSTMSLAQISNLVTQQRRAK